MAKKAQPNRATTEDRLRDARQVIEQQEKDLADLRQKNAAMSEELRNMDAEIKRRDVAIEARDKELTAAADREDFLRSKFRDKENEHQGFKDGVRTAIGGLRVN